MSITRKPQILLTNDDGIRSPGLWTAAKYLSELGYVNVVAPRDQSSGASRSLPYTSDGLIEHQKMTVNGKEWSVYAVGGTPAQAVLHAILEIMSEPPQLVVSGINFGENVGSGVTISGTIGAALEAAALGFPALAVSLETGKENHFSYSPQVDFSAAGYFTAYFARRLLDGQAHPDVHVLKIDVPSDASPQTPWMTTRLSLSRYYEPVPPARVSWDKPGIVGYRLASETMQEFENSDVYVLRVKRWISVTPLSLDLTSRIDLHDLEQDLRAED